MLHSVRKVYAPEVTMARTDEAIRAALHEIGLSPNEIALYRAILAAGPRPASVLAKQLRMQRTRIYDVLNVLESRGLVEMIERNKTRYFAATSADRLRSLLREHRNRVHEQFAAAERSLPELFAATGALSPSVEVREIRGITQIREALTELLADEEHLLLGIGEIELELQGTVGFTKWAKEFRIKRIEQGVTLRSCLQGPPDFIEEQNLRRETLSSPDIPGDILLIASSTVALSVVLKGAPRATRIESELLCSLLNGLSAAWLTAIKRIS